MTGWVWSSENPPLFYGGAEKVGNYCYRGMLMMFSSGQTNENQEEIVQIRSITVSYPGLLNVKMAFGL